MNEDTGRLEAFSDGVMAIAITLLVLDLAVPRASSSKASRWPTRSASSGRTSRP